MIATDGERKPSEAASESRPSAISFITTEHFTLQGARAATIAESTSRASTFLASVSGGLVAWGLVATATGVGGAFFAFGLVLLPTIAFVGFVTFERTLQSAIEDLGYARRIARLRAYYFDNAPELAPYLLSAPPERRPYVERLRSERMQAFLVREMSARVREMASIAASHRTVFSQVSPHFGRPEDLVGRTNPYRPKA